MMRLRDKVAIVTGGGRDIGRAVSLRLAQEGARIVVNFRTDTASAQDTVEEIRAAGGSAILHRADVSQAAEVEGLLAAARGAFGDRIDILANLAGGMVARKPLDEMDEAFFDAVMALNLKSALLVTRATRPYMPRGGSIINVASLAGRDGGGPGAIAYATSKGALMSLTRALAKELGPHGIRVNGLCPGLIGTSFHDTFSTPETRKAVAGATPLRREGRPEEVAAALAFLASDDASFLAGANVDINGGLHFS